MDLSVSIKGKKLANPIGLASGTIGYGSEYESLIDLSAVGALYTKAVTLHPRLGNAVPRIIETPSGLLNSIGLANVGIQAFIRDKAPYLEKLPCAVIPNIAGSETDEYAAVLETLEETLSFVWGYEINVSCPNVHSGGIAFGTDPKIVHALVTRLRSCTAKPLIVKLSPNVTDISVIAAACEDAGADALSCINTVRGMVIDIQTQKSVIPAGIAGLSGPAIRPIGVACVYQAAKRVHIPIIGLGGISSAADAVQYLLAGASAVQIGTANFIEPSTAFDTLHGIIQYMEEHHIDSIMNFPKLH